MSRVDLQKALNHSRQQVGAATETEILDAFKQILRADDEADERIMNSIFGGGGQISKLDISQLNPANVYSLNEIKNICVAYRLRFLDASLFKGDIPAEALSKIKSIQKEQATELTGYKIIAPAPMFHLQERDKDPLLFANLGNGFYYLIHKWGTDLHPLRKILVYPFRDFTTLFKSVVALALFIAVAVPSHVMMGPQDTTSMHIRVIFFFYLLFAFCGLTALYGFSRVKNFNSVLWNSKYFD